MNERISLIDRLIETHRLSLPEWERLIGDPDGEARSYAAAKARETTLRIFGNRIYFRGIIEFTNICRCDCFYCGIRRSNAEVQRYRLTKEEILACCENGYQLGFRTFVLQGGEDSFFTDDRMVEIIREIRVRFPDCAITLSVGERERESYERFFAAGADRYLLRHETADAAHFARLHPPGQTFAHRMSCLRTLREIGYQTGCGMMVGAPGQTPRHLAEDMRFMGEFCPQMIGMGPFLPHHATPFCDEPAGSGELTLFLLSLCRLMLPEVLLPATTALGTLRADGREAGILAGCNVIMPNLSPASERGNYLLYDNKSTREDAAESLSALKKKVASIGYEMVEGRGDAPAGK